MKLPTWVVVLMLLSSVIGVISLSIELRGRLGKR